MAYDPETYLTETAVADFAPITDALIVCALIRTDTERPEGERAMAKFCDEAISGLLRIAATPGDADAVRDAMDAAQAALPGGD
jgi:hypothetical protein